MLWVSEKSKGVPDEALRTCGSFRSMPMPVKSPLPLLTFPGGDPIPGQQSIAHCKTKILSKLVSGYNLMYLTLT